MNEPIYHLENVVHAKAEALEDFDGPLDVIFLLLSKTRSRYRTSAFPRSWSSILPISTR